MFTEKIQLLLRSFISFIVSRSPDLVPRVGLQNDAKRDFARITLRVNNLETMCRCGVQNGVKSTNVISTFFLNYVTVRHCEFSGKDGTDEEFLDFEVPSSYEGEWNLKSKNKTRTECLRIVFMKTCRRGKCLAPYPGFKVRLLDKASFLDSFRYSLKKIS